MAKVTLRRVTSDLRDSCEALQVSHTQQAFIATNAKSLAQAREDNSTHRIPLAVYDVSARGWVSPQSPMIGFAMLELAAGVGFIERLMIDQRFQGHGYGTALLAALIRRLKLMPEVELIATSHRRENIAVARLFERFQFQPWDISFASENPHEVFLQLAIE